MIGLKSLANGAPILVGENDRAKYVDKKAFFV